MEYLIFNLSNLVALAIFAALTCLPFYLLYRIGARFEARSGRAVMRWALPAVVFISVLTWILASVAAFQNSCKAVPGIALVSTPRVEATGFGLQGAPDTFVSTEFSWNTALETGTVQFVDLREGRRCAGKKQHEDQPAFPIEAQCDQSPRAALVVHLLPPKASGHWWRPPIFQAAIEVRHADTGQVLVRATDLVFGGGLLGRYLALLGGDQDFQRLSCGYASPSIGPWRPTLATRPRVADYRKADLKLLTTAMGRP